jgi:hypothetical protein
MRLSSGLGHYLWIVPRGAISPFYHLCVYSDPFPRPSRLSALEPLDYTLLSVHGLLGVI